MSYENRYDDTSPKGALGMFRSRIRRALGHAVIFAWSDLIADRNRKLVGLQLPAACAAHAGVDSSPNFENGDLLHAWLGITKGNSGFVVFTEYIGNLGFRYS